MNLFPMGNKIFDTTERLLFRCLCGGHCYLDVYFDFEDKIYSFVYVQRPYSLWQRIKYAFETLIGKHDNYINEVLLEKEDMRRLYKALKKHEDYLF